MEKDNKDLKHTESINKYKDLEVNDDKTEIHSFKNEKADEEIPKYSEDECLLLVNEASDNSDSEDGALSESETEQCFYASFKIYLSPPPLSPLTLPPSPSFTPVSSHEHRYSPIIYHEPPSPPIDINPPFQSLTYQNLSPPIKFKDKNCSVESFSTQQSKLPPPPSCRPPPLSFALASKARPSPKSCPPSLPDSYSSFFSVINSEPSCNSSNEQSKIKSDELSNLPVFKFTESPNGDEVLGEGEESVSEEDEPTLSLCVPETKPVITEELESPKATFTHHLCTSDDDVSLENDLDFDSEKSEMVKFTENVEQKRTESPVFFIDPVDWIKSEGPSPIPTLNTGHQSCNSFQSFGRSVNSPIPFRIFASHGSDLDTLDEEEVSERNDNPGTHLIDYPANNLAAPESEHTNTSLPRYSPLRRASCNDYRSRSMTPGPDRTWDHSEVRQRKITIPIVSKRNTFMVGN